MREEIENKKEKLKQEQEAVDKLVATWELYENGGKIYYNLPLKNELDEYYSILTDYYWTYKSDYKTFTRDLRYFKNIIKLYSNVDFIHTFDFNYESDPEEIYEIQVTDELMEVLEKICQELKFKISEIESELKELDNESKTGKDAE